MVAATPGFVPCVEMPFEPIRLDAPTIDVETTNGYIALTSMRSFVALGSRATTVLGNRAPC